MSPYTSPDQQIAQIVRLALKEDQCHSDITTRILVPEQHRSTAVIRSREACVVSGIAAVRRVFRSLDPQLKITVNTDEGKSVRRNGAVLTLQGRTRAILSGERVALNLLARMSAIATKTRQYVDAVRPYRAAILDTRKTTPNLRVLERQAVAAGGGTNHRFDLSEMVMIKDNHLVTQKGTRTLGQIIALTRRRTRKPIICEVDTLQQFQDVLPASPDIILLDNFSPAQIKKAIRLRERQPVGTSCRLEASGGITLKNVKRYAATGIDRLSIGDLTHSIKAVDMTLEISHN